MEGNHRCFEFKAISTSFNGQFRQNKLTDMRLGQPCMIREWLEDEGIYQWHRGCIVGFLRNSVEVVFQDLCNTVHGMPPSDVFKMPLCFQNIPTFCATIQSARYEALPEEQTIVRFKVKSCREISIPIDHPRKLYSRVQMTASWHRVVERSVK